MPRRRRRLRQEVVLIFCTLLVIICGVILVGPTIGKNPQDVIQDEEIHQKMVDETNISELLGNKGVNIGESTKIRTLLRDKLPAGLFFNTYDITLNKLTVNYAKTERSNHTDEDYAAFWTEDNCQQIVMYNTAALFVLIRNLDIIEINIDGYNLPTCIITREEAGQLFGAELGDIATAEDWQQTLISGGVYDEQKRQAFFAAHTLSRNIDPAANA